ncbi:MAG: type II secretion system protein GspG [Desulfobacterales bacterium C00003060]|nr:MAG: type II secretion system protein GspG [Desulfobacterales bacterium S3730MH5]OEU78513.1 MAG: type II secretion system protein GspG [Desulfobacterales bacterium C00003060]OEU84815.1 MAG: type II secretion system protein GspG [Desulfobacterales bacterium S5133MH4]
MKCLFERSVLFVKSLRKEEGFTLIELLIVMVIIGLLAALVGPRMFGKVGKSRQNAAKAQISLFETALDTYRLDVGKYPTSEQGLEALRVQPDGVEKWDGPYLPKDVPSDPWGNLYVYQSPGENGDYDIISLGADGKSEGEGEDTDIVSWKDIGK